MTKSLSVVDFETASAVDLKKVGAWAYAEHPTTEVLCLSFEQAGDGLTMSTVTWWPGHRNLEPLLLRMVNDPEVFFVSHGDFERAIWHHIMVPIYGFPPLPNERWHDTISVAAMKQLPLELEKLTRVLGSPFGKDMEGRKLVLSLSKPDKKTGMLDRRPVTLARVYQYCESDVREERWVHGRLGFLQPGEREVWLLDQKINQRGVKIDLDYVLACQKVVDGATTPLAAEFSRITGGLSFTQRDRIMDWIGQQGAGIPDLRKDTIKELLGGSVDEDDDDIEDNLTNGRNAAEGRGLALQPAVRRVLEIRQLVGSAAIKKLPRMLGCVNADGRARGLLQYHRAGPGRWAGRIIQPQNFPRPSIKEGAMGKDGKPEDRLVPVDTMVGALMTGDWEYVEMVLGSANGGQGAVEAVVSGLRHALHADHGRVFISGDYAQIEARIVLALAGQHDKVKLFETGTPYVDMAESIYGRKVSKKNDIAEYTIGKNTVLGCGFQMAGETFNNRYCPKQPREFADRVIRTYRKEWAPKVPPLWYALEKAAVDAVWSKQPREAYGVEYRLEGDWLTARLPSGRKLYYWNPQPVKTVAPWTDDEGGIVMRPSFTYQALKGGVWRTVYAFGGLLTENVVQGLARDVLVYAMFNLEKNGFPLVLTVHDEALGEPEKVLADEKAFGQIMQETAPWVKAMGVPIAVETWIGDRYRK